MSWDWLNLQAAWAVALGIATIGLTATRFYLRSAFVPRSKFTESVEAMNQALGALAERVDQCERRHDGTATKVGLAALELDIEKLRGNMTGLTERLNGVADLFERFETSVERVDRAVNMLLQHEISK